MPGELISRSQLTLAKFGLGFFFRSAWDPVNGNFGALPFIYGTLMSSFLALLISVPLALGVAIFLTEMCPKWLRAPLSFLTELLAAIPSVVYGSVGHLCPGPAAARPREPDAHAHLWAGPASSRGPTPATACWPRA